VNTNTSRSHEERVGLPGKDGTAVGDDRAEELGDDAPGVCDSANADGVLGETVMVVRYKFLDNAVVLAPGEGEGEGEGELMIQNVSWLRSSL